MQITCIIFDLDGVIVDSEPIYFALEREMFAELGISVLPDEHATFVGMPGREMWQKLKSKHGISQLPDDLMRDGMGRFRKKLSALGEKGMMPGIRKLIGGFRKKGLSIAVASSTDKKVVMEILTLFKLADNFDVIIGGNEVSQGKPAPDIFLKAAESLNKKPDECLVIEDSQNGVKAAKAAGMMVIALRNPGSGNQDLSEADVIVDSLSQIKTGKIQAQR